MLNTTLQQTAGRRTARSFGRALWVAAFLWVAFSYHARGNDLRLTNVGLVNQNTTDGHVQVRFDIAWDNSWRLPVTLSPANWDAAWVFVKFKVGFVNPNFTVASAASAATVLNVSSTTDLRVGQPLRIRSGTGTLAAGTVIAAIDTANSQITLSTGTTAALTDAVLEAERIWEAAWLNNTGHNAPTGSSIQIGLPDETVAGGGFNASTNPGMGAFIYRSSAGSGNFSAPQVVLRWNYRAQGLGDEVVIDLRVFGVEMVHLQESSFWLGSGGTESNSFTSASSTSGNTVPLLIGDTPPTLQGNNAGSDSLNLGARGATDLTGTGTGALATNFPTGYSAFYSMKYEVSQQEYVDFLNSLSRQQQQARTATALSSGTSSVTNRYVLSGTAGLNNRNGIRCDATIDAFEPISFYCDLNGNGTGGELADGKAIACNYLSWADLAAFLDWAGLRPMTELEFERACRGDTDPFPEAYAWANDLITAATGISSSGERSETASNGASNAVYNNEGGVAGPLRVGSFADDESSRREAGAGVSGVMELSGNLWERAVTVGNPEGRSFTGAHGDGGLTAAGSANASSWPADAALGAGLRGGSWTDGAARLAVSDRERAAETLDTRENNTGGRGARLQPITAAIDGNL